MKALPIITVAFTATVLIAPAVAEDRLPATPGSEDYVYTNEDLEKYYAPDPPLTEQEEVRALFDPLEWTIVEAFLERSFDRIDAERRESIARVLAQERARDRGRPRYSVPYRGVYGYQAVQMWLWDRYWDRDRRDGYGIPEPVVNPHHGPAGSHDGRDAVPRRPMPGRSDEPVRQPTIRPYDPPPNPHHGRAGRFDGRDAVPKRTAPSRTRAPSRHRYTAAERAGRGDGRDAVPKRTRP
jgi:hypothetical protein